MTRKERALKIAEMEGWEKSKIHAFPVYYYRNTSTRRALYQLESEYSSFDGLMPLVERVNKNFETHFAFDIDAFEINVYVNLCATHFELCRFDSLIDALQEAIIYYYENKEKEG